MTSVGSIAAAKRNSSLGITLHGRQESAKCVGRRSRQRGRRKQARLKEVSAAQRKVVHPANPKPRQAWEASNNYIHKGIARRRQAHGHRSGIFRKARVARLRRVPSTGRSGFPLFFYPYVFPYLSISPFLYLSVSLSLPPLSASFPPSLFFTTTSSLLLSIGRT